MKPTPLLCLATLLTALPATLTAEPPGSGYELLFEDNFNGTTLNTNAWAYRLGRRGGEANFSHINGYNRAENVTVSNGCLHVRVDREPVDGQMENTGGGIITRRRFGYGYYECRYRPFMLGTGGVHSAFWQRGIPGDPRDPAADPTAAKLATVFEIDSSEIDSPRWIATDNLYDVIAPKAAEGEYPWPARFHIPVAPQEGGWFVDAYDYTPTGVIFYDNGQEVARVDYDRVRAQQNIWLTALNGFGQSVDHSVFPGASSFDYFRYYAKDYPGANLLANDSFEYNLDRFDPQLPVAWREEGDADASLVSAEKPATGQACLLHASDAPYTVTTSQTLQHIRNGNYTATARVRSSGGQKVARFSVRNHGGPERSKRIAASKDWTTVTVDNIEVTNHTATIAFNSEANSGQWLAVDDVCFLKPVAPGQPTPPARPFEAVRDPIWQILPKPMTFGDGRFLFFGRQVGWGDAFTVRFTMKPAKRAEQVVLERLPREGGSGWSVRLTPAGELVFRLGNAETFTDVTTPGAYDTTKETRVACVFDRGTATVYLDGKPVTTQGDIPQRPDDKTAAGTVAVHRTSTKLPYAGELSGLRIHNRALTATELSAP